MQHELLHNVLNSDWVLRVKSPKQSAPKSATYVKRGKACKIEPWKVLHVATGCCTSIERAPTGLIGCQNCISQLEIPTRIAKSSGSHKIYPQNWHFYPRECNGAPVSTVLINQCFQFAVVAWAQISFSLRKPNKLRWRSMHTKANSGLIQCWLEVEEEEEENRPCNLLAKSITT